MLASRWWTSARRPHATTSRLLRGSALSLFFALSLPAVSAHAVAEDACIRDEKCKEHYNKAVKNYREELYDEALTEFQAAYQSRAMSVLLVNIGRTLQKLGRPKEAISYYERFLRAEAKLDPETQKRVSEYITQARALVGPEPEKPEDKRPNGDGDGDKGKPVVTAPVTPPPAPPPPGRNLLIAGGALAFVGIAGLAVGGGLYAVSSSRFDAFQNTRDEFEKLAAKTDAQNYGNGSIVGYALGVGALAGSAVLFGLGARKLIEHRRSTSTTVPKAALLFGPAGGALVLHGEY